VDLGDAYLAASVVGAANTANAIRPVRRKGLASVLAFGPGQLTSELPLQTLGWQALATVGAAAAGALRTGTGKLGLAVSLGSWAGLVHLHKGAQAAAQVLEQALVDELGADYENRYAATVVPAGATRLTRREIGLPNRGRRHVYGKTRGISYGDAGYRNTLDVWRRADLPTDGAAPVLLQVHGGAWVIGDKREQGGPLMGLLAERGWVCVAINYRLSPRATWPDHIVDVKRAIAWVKAHIHEYGGDPEFIAITGGSAGGHLSSLAALSANEPAFQPGFEEQDTTVQAAVPFYGVYDWTNRDGSSRADMEDFLSRAVLKSSMVDDMERWSQASTMSWVRPDAPPFFVLHGTNDSLVPVEQARSFVDMLRKESEQPVVYAELPYAQHAFEIFSSVRAIHSVRAVERFLAVVRGSR
jgi:acetyl esterase/lipase